MTKLTYLKELKAKGEEACEAALENSGVIGGAVNWGDLHCTGAEYFLQDDGYESYRIYVEEASPDAGDLINWLEEYMFNAGWDCEVITEW